MLVNFRELAKKTARLFQAEKAEKIVILDVRKLTFLTEYFLLANATSSLHLRTLKDTLNEHLGKENISPIREEKSSSSWQVLDYGSLIVHLFLPDIRNFYNLEKFWQGAKTVPWETIRKKKKVVAKRKKKTTRKPNKRANIRVHSRS